MTTALLQDNRSADWPLDAGSTRTPIALLLHGYGSNERDLGGLASALGLRMPWASLRAPIEMSHGGAAWFEVVVPGDPDQSVLDLAVDRIWVWVDANAGPDAMVTPIGFSQGGLMASELLRSRPDRVLAPVILGGFVSSAEHAADTHLAAERPAVFWGRGSEDRVIGAPAIARTAEFLPAHASLVQHVYPGLAHGISADEVADVRTFLASHVGHHSVDL